MERWATEYFEKTAGLSGLGSKLLFTGNMLANALNPAALEMLPSTPGFNGRQRRGIIGPLNPGSGHISNSAVSSHFKLPSVPPMMPGFSLPPRIQ